MENLGYSAHVYPNGEGGWIVKFRDIPEAFTEIWSMDELQNTALDCLVTAMDFYIEDGRKFPEPSKGEDGDYLIEVPASIRAKILLLNTMIDDNIRPVDLARKMKVRTQDVTRILNIGHTTKIDTIEQALKALDKHMYIGAC